MAAIKEGFEIDGRAYETVKLNIFRATAVHAKVMKALGAGLSTAMSTVDKNQSKEAMVLAVTSALTQADTESLVEMMPEMIGEVFVNNERLTPQLVESHFGDYPQDLYPVFFWALAVNISPFLGGSGQGWKAFMGHLGFKSQKDGGKPGSSVARSPKG
jgi:hypothetical protein